MVTSVLARLAAVPLLFLALVSVADAKTRHALMVGVGTYKDASGLAKLTAPANDAELMKAALSAGGVDFVTDVATDDDVADKSAFNAVLRRFLSRVQPGDEVLFFFSGHGFHVPGQGNYFLLPDAKAQTVYIKDLGNAASRELDTQDKRDKRYRDWIADVAVSEVEVEKALLATKAEVVVLIVDACRNLVGPTKGASIAASGVGLPREISSGTYRIYSASPGQVSLDSPDRGAGARATNQDRPAARKDAKRDDKRETSLFTRVLLQELQVPRLEINVLFSKVKIEVREQARKLGVEQIPDFYDSKDATLFYFRDAGGGGELEARCATAPNELAQLRYGVSSGSVSRNQLELKKGELAPCGVQYVVEIEKLLKFESQGAGALSTGDLARFVDVANVSDPAQICDLFASSPLDPNRPQGISGFEVQKIALEALKNPAERTRATEAIARTIAGCETAVQERPRVARYKFNLARTHYALATMTDVLVERETSLARASLLNQDAVDQGYVAAFNNLAIMLQNGEYYETNATGAVRRPPDRRKAFDYLKRGADLGHVVAQYNLGMAYKNGELGAEVAAVGEQSSAGTGAPTIKTREVMAYQYLSRAAEAGFVPAMIETAVMQAFWANVPGTRKRAIELLEVASSRGSWEAMYWLARIYDQGGSLTGYSDQRLASIEYADAAVWYSRAAEAGDTRAQTRLASMLLDGEGLPAAQPDSAARYLRLAAAAGSTDAQMMLAGRLRDGKVMFRPRTDGRLDGGASEIRSLYVAAFARGNSEAGLHLGRLFRTGFPVDRPSDAIPKSPAIAAKLFWDTIDKVRAADQTTEDSRPEVEVLAAVELIRMYDAGESKGLGGPDAITEDQIDQLKTTYGDVSRLKYIRTSAVGPVYCRGKDFWVLIWDTKSKTVPTDAQFDWFERNRKCKDLTPEEREQRDKDVKAKRDVIKEADLGIPKRTRDAFKREFDAALKDPKKTFVDRVVELVSAEKKKKSR